MADLRTDYKDDLLDTSVNTQRKYNVVNNDDGTVSFEDATVYTQNGDTFGASEVNQIHEAVNMVNDSLTLDFSNARPDVQDLNTFLQKALEKLFPKIINVFPGNQFKYITDTGATSSQYGTITSTQSVISRSGASGSSCNVLFYLETPIDLTAFSKITFIYTQTTYKGATSDGVTLNLNTEKPYSISTLGTDVKTTARATAGTYTETLDISALSGEYYIKVRSTFWDFSVDSIVIE